MLKHSTIKWKNRDLGGRKMLDGKKTYIVGIATIAYAIGGAIIGKVDWNVAIPLVLGALSVFGIRIGMNK